MIPKKGIISDTYIIDRVPHAVVFGMGRGALNEKVFLDIESAVKYDITALE